MASVTSNPSVVAPMANGPVGSNTIRIEPPRGWFDLHLKELWDYRELLYFFVWRDVKVRYKQTVIGVLWVVLQPLLTMGVFTLFFGRLAKLPSNGLPYPVFYFTALVPWTYFSTALLELHQRRRRQSARHHQSLFPTARPSTFCRRLWLGRLRHRLRRPPCRHRHLRH